MTRADQRELDGIESRITLAEAALDVLHARLNEPEVISDYRRLQELTGEIEQSEAAIVSLYSRWEELEGKKTIRV
jgi:ATP-binding cassette subfamily F protein uup